MAKTGECCFFLKKKIDGKDFFPLLSEASDCILINTLDHRLFYICLSAFSRFLRLPLAHSDPSFSPSLCFSRSLPFPSVTLKQSDAGESADCARRHGNAALMMATSVTRRLDWRASGRGMGCEATAQLTPQFCPLICFFSLHLFISVGTLPLLRQPIMGLNGHLIEAGLASSVW